jgi:MerR family transcriptional regulator, light-induced transcriptional regulator
MPRRTAIPQLRPAIEIWLALLAVKEALMERSGLEGTHGEAADRVQFTPDCGSALGQIPIEGIDQNGLDSPDSVQRLSRLLATLETDIIPRLARVHRTQESLLGRSELSVVIDAGDVDRFARALIAVQDKQARRTVADLLAMGLHRETLYLELFAPAARCLGDLWVEDECTFGDVTVGLGRLQFLMHELIASAPLVDEAPMDGHRVLLLASPGEQHTLGLSIVSEFFRAARWDVTCTTDSQAPDPVSTVKSEWFDVIGFSAGTHTRLDWLAIAIADVRRVSRNSAIVALVGGPVFSIHPEYVATVGADASAADGQQAPVVAGRLLRQRTLCAWPR